MRVIISGGGTAGHINPALSIAGEIKSKYPTAKILFVGTKKGLESTLVPQEGYKISYIDVSGFKRSLSPENLMIAVKAVSARHAAKKIINGFTPDIVIGTGGYVSGPIVSAAQKMGILTAIHEQNAYWGVTTRLLSKKANRIFLSFEPSEEQKKQYGEKIRVTGNPIRRDIVTFDRSSSRRVLGIDERPLVLSFGGSLGAKKINEAMLYVLKKSEEEKKLNHIHGTGKRDRAFMEGELKRIHLKYRNSGNIRILEYIHDMPRVLAACDLVICRGGAITLAELSAAGKPAIIIPSPNVTENHQYHNALVYEKGNAAVIIEDRELTGERLYSEIKRLTESGRLPEMAKNMLSFKKDRASSEILKGIEELMLENSKGYAK